MVIQNKHRNYKVYNRHTLKEPRLLHKAALIDNQTYEETLELGQRVRKRESQLLNNNINICPSKKFSITFYNDERSILFLYKRRHIVIHRLLLLSFLTLVLILCM